jgi:hypothetical protein
MIEGYSWKLLRKGVIGALFATFFSRASLEYTEKECTGARGGRGVQYSVALLALALLV